MLLMTETNLDVFHAQLLTPQDAPAMDQLCAACGTPGGPDTAALLQTNAVLGDYAGIDTLQAAMAMLPMFGQSRLALALRAAGFGADGQGIVLAPPAFTAQYLPVRRFLAMALGLAKQRCASYHIWAALPLTPTPDGEELCAQYLASGLTLRGGGAGQPAAAGVCGPHPGGPRQHGAPRTLAGSRPAAPFGARRRRGRFWLG